MYKGLKTAVISLGVIAAIMFVFAPSASAHDKAMGGEKMSQDKSMMGTSDNSMRGDEAFFRPESYWHRYDMSPTHGYYSDNSDRGYTNGKDWPGYHENYDKFLPRTSYTSPKRWLP